MSESTPKTTNVQVAVRCRPANSEEKKGGQPLVVSCDPESKAVRIAYGIGSKKVTKAYNFDKIFGMYSTQEEVFQAMVVPIVDEVLAGFNCTIFAYGQTGTGKTHTMEGEINSDEHAGIVPRSVRAIYENLVNSGNEFTIRVSFLELYNEELQDLLSDGSGADKEKRLRLCEDLKRGVVCQNLEEITVLNVAHIFEILKKGIEQRQTAATLMNKNSSRSHSIFTMKIMTKETLVDGEEVLRQGQLNLVDLAGSECVGRSGAKDSRAREAGSINQSLLTLGRVISALVDHLPHIPYRDSKLTRLLQESLGGRTKTCIIATMSPSLTSLEETLSTLDYANRAKSIKNTPQVNQRTSKKAFLGEYGAEIEKLRSQLQLAREKNGVFLDPAEYEDMLSRLSTQEMQLVECESTLKCRTEEVKQLRIERDTLESKLQNVTKELEETKYELSVTQDSVRQLTADLWETRAELEATGAVVLEQVQTEGALTGQARDLQTDLQLRREDISALFNKVNRHMERERVKIEATGSLLTVLDGNKMVLLENVDVMNRLSSEHSKELVKGVGKMIERGQQTCQVLEDAVSTALSVLLNDATDAKNTMTSACSDLSVHLRDTNDRLALLLKTLQDELSTWLGSLDVSLKEAKAHLQAQELQLSSLRTSVSDQARHYADTNNGLVEEFVLASIEAQKVTQALQLDMKSRLSAYSADQKLLLNDAMDLVKRKADEYEKAMSIMFKDIVSSQLAALATAEDEVDSFSSKTIAQSNLDMETQLKNFDSLQKLMSNSSSRLTNLVESSAKSNGSSVEELISTRTATDYALDGISQEVLSQQCKLNDTVDSLTEDLAVAIEHGCGVVSQTSQTAESILGDVSCAAETMSQATTSATESFSAFLVDEGKHVEGSLDDLFDDMNVHLTQQKSIIINVGQSIKQFNDSDVNSALRATGTTPKKSNFPAIPILCETRDHAVIKAECRSQYGTSSSSATAVSSKGTVGMSSLLTGLENTDPQLTRRHLCPSAH